MSRRDPVPAPEPPAPEPRRKKVEAKDAKIFKPSNFASRKAEADANNAKLAERRLVSLGQSDYAQKNLRTGELEYFEVEIFADLDKPIDRWVKFPGPNSGLVPLQDYTVKDEVVRSALKRPFSRPQVSAFTGTQLDDDPPRKV